MVSPEKQQAKSLMQVDSFRVHKLLNEEELLNDTPANSKDLKTKGDVILFGEAKDLNDGITQFNR